MRKVIFPGSFDPIHMGHVDIACRAANLFDEVVIAVYDKPLKSLLFSPRERIAMVKEATKAIPNVTVMGYNGLTVKFAKQIGALAIIRGLRVISDFEYEFRMSLANKRLDPEMELVALVTDELNSFVSSSLVKEIASLGGDVSSMVPTNVLKALQKRYQIPGPVDA